MPRIRTIKPEFWTSPQVARVSYPARLLFIGTWSFADDYGNLPRDAEKLKMQVFPGDTIDVEPLVRSLIEHGLLAEYSAKDTGAHYLHIPTFSVHQVINRPSKTAYPPPPKALLDSLRREKNSESVSTHEGLTEPSTRRGKERKGKEGSKPKTVGTKEVSGAASRARAHTRESTPSSPDTDPVTDETPSAITAAMLTRVMRSHSISATPSDPRMIAAAANGITPQTIEAACIEAKECAKGSRIPAGYVLKIAEHWTHDAKKMQKPNGNGHAPAPVSREFDERSKDRKRTIAGLTGKGKLVVDVVDVVDIEAKEIGHGTRHS